MKNTNKITGWALWHSCEHCNNFAVASPEKAQCELALQKMKDLKLPGTEQLQIIQVEIKPLES